MPGISAQAAEDPGNEPEEPRGGYRGHPGDYGTCKPDCDKPVLRPVHAGDPAGSQTADGGVVNRIKIIIWR